MRKALDRPSLTDFTVEEIRRAILSNELPPGTFTTAEELAKTMSVSRTPVREALLRLQRAGMVCIERNRGVRILPVSMQDLEDAFQLRLMLEVPATYRAAILVDEETLDNIQAELDSMTVGARERDYPKFMDSDARFHELIHLASGNRRLASTVRHVRQTITDRGVFSSEHLPDLYVLLGEHKLIRDALVARSAAAAADAMYQHLSGVGTKALKHEDWFDSTWFSHILPPSQATAVDG